MLDGLKEKLKAEGQISLRVKIHAGAKQTRIKSILSDGTIKIDIAKAPEDGKANESLIKLLSNDFDVKADCILIQYGKFSADKTVLIKIN